VTTKFQDLVGLTLSGIEGAVDAEEVLFHTTEGKTFKLFHKQDCCEHVRVAEIIGDLDDLVGSPIALANEVTNQQTEISTFETQTWTFYNLATINGYVTLRWLGESNGFYSEEVDFVEVVA